MNKWKTYLLHLAQYTSLLGAITTASMAIYPLLINKANWQEIITTFLIALIFTMLTALISHVKDANLQKSLSDDLNAIRLLLPTPSVWRATTATTAAPVPPANPPAAG